MPVLRLERIKYENLKRAIKHRCQDRNWERVYEEINRRFRAIETLNGLKNLRKDASLFEIVIAYEDEKSGLEIERDIETLIEILERKLKLREFTYHYFVHYKKGRNHIHFLFTGRNSQGKKIKINSRVFDEIKTEFLGKNYRIERLVYETKKQGGIGVYPLWAIRELEREAEVEEVMEFVKTARRLRISKSKFTGLVMSIKKKERGFYEVLEELRRKWEEREREKRKRENKKVKRHRSGMRR